MLLFAKICGITRLEDAEYALECGASSLGFVFWPRSPRAIEPDAARAIAASVPSALIVGVFVNQPQEEVSRIAAEVPLDAVQLHGDETVEYAAALTRPVLKAIAVNGVTDETVDVWPDSTMVLLDAHDPDRRGGTGRTVDWKRAAALARRRPVVLAGGLQPDNVGQAICSVRPFGIDVSSGVEARPGVKDRFRLDALFAAIKAASAGLAAMDEKTLPMGSPEARWLRACGWDGTREARRP